MPYLDITQAVFVLTQELKKEREERKRDRAVAFSVLQLAQELLRRLPKDDKAKAEEVG
jgi:hypothetical protein